MPRGTDFEIITPRLSVVEPGDIRQPDDDEVLLAHGVSPETMRTGRIGALSILGYEKGTIFIGAYVPWHCDGFLINTHLTQEGTCQAKLAGIPREHIPRSAYANRRLRKRLDEKALQVDLSIGDLLIFNCAASDLPIMHSFTTLVKPRCSVAFPAEPATES